MEIVPVILLVSFVATISLGIYVLRKGIKKPINTTFAGFSFFMALWNAMIFVQIVFGAILVAGRLAFSFAIMGLAFFFLFCLLFPERKHLALWTWVAALSPAIIFFIIPLAGDLFIAQTAVENGQILLVATGSLYNYYTPLPPLYILGAVIVLVVKYIRVTGPYRQHLKYLLIGTGFYMVPAVLTNLLLPNIFGIYDLNSLGPAFSIFLMIAVSYAIARYRLFDIHIVLSESIFFLLSVGALIVFYYAMSEFTESHLSATVITLLAAFVFRKYVYNPLREYVFTSTLRYARILQDISDYVRDSASLSADEFIDEILRRLKRGLHAYTIGVVLFPEAAAIFHSYYRGTITAQNAPSSVAPIRAFFLSNTEFVLDRSELEESLKNGFSPRQVKRQAKLLDDMRAMDAEIAFPIAYGKRLFGIMVFGQKDTRDGYTLQDFEIMSHAGKLSAYVFELKRSAVAQALKQRKNSKKYAVSNAN